MEYCRGGELFHEINERRKLKERWTEKQVARLMAQIFKAVNYMHQNLIIHRDIKADNILYVHGGEGKGTGRIKIIDFGTSTKFVKGCKLTDFYGTAYYMAPEMINGRYTEACDVWSCGVLMYTMIMGKVPFDGFSEKEIFNNILN